MTQSSYSICEALIRAHGKSCLSLLVIGDVIPGSGCSTRLGSRASFRSRLNVGPYLGSRAISRSRRNMSPLSAFPKY